MIKILNLSKNYGSKEVLKNINLEIGKGSIFGLIGPNGAGKTTLIKCILDQISFDGKILLNNSNNKEYLKNTFNKIGYMPENIFVYEFLTGIEFIKFTLDLKNLNFSKLEKKIDLLLELLELKDSKNKLIRNYSHGMKRKIALITLLIQNPEIMLLDEPITGFDAKSIIVVKKIIKSMAENGCTIFITSHIIDFLGNLCDHVAILNSNELAYNNRNFDGNKNELDKKYVEIVSTNLKESINNYISLI